LSGDRSRRTACLGCTEGSHCRVRVERTTRLGQERVHRGPRRSSPGRTSTLPSRRLRAAPSWAGTACSLRSPPSTPSATDTAPARTHPVGTRYCLGRVHMRRSCGLHTTQICRGRSRCRCSTCPNRKCCSCSCRQRPRCLSYKRRTAHPSWRRDGLDRRCSASRRSACPMDIPCSCSCPPSDGLETDRSPCTPRSRTARTGRARSPDTRPRASFDRDCT